jgi:hypothetical protein
VKGSNAGADLELFAPELLDAMGLPAQIGAAEELGPSFLSELLGVQGTFDDEHVALPSSGGLGSTDTAVGNESEHTLDDASPSESTASPPPSLSQCTSSQTDISSETNQEEEGSPEVRRLQLRALESRLFRKRKKVRRAMETCT